MSLVKGNPEVSFNNISSWVERIFGEELNSMPMSAINRPSVNRLENKKEITLEFAASGYHNDDFLVEIINDRLQISAGERTSNAQKEAFYTRNEWKSAAFRYSLPLPSNVDANLIYAQYEAGILRVGLPKFTKQ
jgi:HSP20 family protein